MEAKCVLFFNELLSSREQKVEVYDYSLILKLSFSHFLNVSKNAKNRYSITGIHQKIFGTSLVNMERVWYFPRSNSAIFLIKNVTKYIYSFDKRSHLFWLGKIMRKELRIWRKYIACAPKVFAKSYIMKANQIQNH